MAQYLLNIHLFRSWSVGLCTLPISNQSRFDCGGVIKRASATGFFCPGECPNSRCGILVPALGVTALCIASWSRNIFNNAYMTQMGQLALRRPDFTLLTSTSFWAVTYSRIQYQQWRDISFSSSTSTGNNIHFSDWITNNRHGGFDLEISHFWFFPSSCYIQFDVRVRCWCLGCPLTKLLN